MRILIDFTQVPLEKCGIGIYALNLVLKLYEMDKKNTYYLLIQNDDDSLGFINSPCFKIITVNSKIFRKFIFRCMLEQFYIPFLAFRYKINVVHSIHYSFPLLLCAKRVVTIPDMTFFKFPERHLTVKRLYFRFFIYAASLLADKVITISNSSRNDYLQRFKAPPESIEVVYLGKSAVFNTNLDKSRIDLVKKKYRICNEYILYLGTIEPRKNIQNLITAFDKFRKEVDGKFQLVIAGKKGWHYNGIFRMVEDLSLKEKVIFTGFVAEDEKPFLIGGAKIFVYPSIYEGFGIPVLEALSCGIPTITSNVSSLPEVAGDAAILIDPNSIDELGLSIKRLYNDGALYEQLRAKSVAQSSKFSWERCAYQTINLYNSLG